MGIPIDIVGLNNLLPEVSDSSILTVEGDIDPSKKLFIHGLCASCNRADRRFRYISSLGVEETRRELERGGSVPDGFDVIQEKEINNWKDHVEDGGMLVIDSFSYLMLGRNVYDFIRVLDGIRENVKSKDAIVVLAVEGGMVDDKLRTMIHYRSDSVIQFVNTVAPETTYRYITVPKWQNSFAIDKNIYFTVENDELVVDIRARVI